LTKKTLTYRLIAAVSMESTAVSSKAIEAN